MIGETVSHYRITKQLGAGGMGVVFEAEDLRLRRAVALKFLPPHLLADRTARARFIHEARAASALQHPAICSIHDIGETDDGRTFLVMPRYEGETLAEKLERGPVQLGEAIAVFSQVVEGLAAAHRRGIVHRDIKPANIFVTNDGHAVILDFGLAKLAGHTQLTQAGTTLGTVAYMSPEQVRGEEVGPESDIWSLGVVLYEMLSGNRLFVGEHPQAVMYAVCHAEMPPLPDVPAEIRDLVSGLLLRDPKQRELSTAHLANVAPSTGSKSRLPQLLGMGVLLAVVVLVGNRVWESKPVDAPTGAAKKSIAVGPFDNLTGDAEYDIWSFGLSELIISELSRSPELRVLDRQTFMDVLEAMGEPRTAGVGLPVARDLASRADVATLVTGSILKAGSAIRVQARLQDVETGALLGTNQVEGNSENDFFAMADSLAAKVKNDLELETMHEERGEALGFMDLGTNSAEAYRKYIEGMDAFAGGDYRSSIQLLTAALAIDSLFVAARTQLVGAYVHSLQHEEARNLHVQLIEDIDRLPPRYQYELRAMEAYFNKDRFSEIYWFRKVLEANPQRRMIWYYLNMSHFFVEQYEAALACLDTVMDLSLRWGAPFHFVYYYSFYAESCLASGQFERGISVMEKGLELFPDNSWLMNRMTALHLAGADTVGGREWLNIYHDRLRDRGKPECDIMIRTGRLYADAGNFGTAHEILRAAIPACPDEHIATINLAGILIEQEIDVAEGVALLEGLEPGCSWCSSSLLYSDYLGWGYHLQGRDEEAVELLQKSWDEAPFAVLKRKRRLEEAKGAL